MKIVSIALFGEGNEYAKYLPSFILAHLNLFPLEETWMLRVHLEEGWRSRISKDRTFEWLWFMAGHGVIQVRDIPHGTPLAKAALWRVAPVFDTANYVFSRDLDSIPMPRDRTAVDQFIASNAVVHTIHDNPQHFGMMAGLCGFRSAAFREATGLKTFDELCAVGDALGVDWTRKGGDQAVLNAVCLRDGGPVLLEHRYNGWSLGPRRFTPRSAARYMCSAHSTPTPNVGTSALPAKDLQEKADLLGGHLGTAGYEYHAAEAFWREHGRADIAKLVPEGKTWTPR